MDFTFTTKENKRSESSLPPEPPDRGGDGNQQQGTKKTIEKVSFRDKVLGSQTVMVRERTDLLAAKLAHVELIRGNRLMPMLHVEKKVIEDLNIPWKKRISVSEQNMDPWLLTVVYASPRDHERNETWQRLHQMATSIQETWIMMGDFNEIANPDEKKGGAPVDIKNVKILTIGSMIVECKRALFDMGPNKAPGEDGYPALFFQHYWEIVGDSLHQYVNQVWSNPSLISSINNTMLVVIHKVDKPEFVSQFRPIALCNVTYKIITKIIVNRIKPLLNSIISPYQSSFIPGRTIHHNIIVAQEMVHSMSKMKGNKCFMSIKIDLKKAYDRLNWNFVEECLAEYQVEANYWKPMHAGRSGPKISHLLFADDLLLFAEAYIEQAHCVMHCLEQFCLASGQNINSQKTQIFFSKNVDQRTRDDIVQHTGFTQVNNLGKYLGANIAPGRSTRGKFQHIIGKIQNRLSGWKQQCLSFAGRLTLSKSVLSSIPYYHMQYAKLPKTLCDDMEKIQRGFLWGDKEEQRKPHLIGWDICCLSKNDGGLGIKSPHLMNEAFLMKILWNLINKPDDLWCQVLYSKYGRKIDLRFEIISQPYDSPLWKALTGIWEQFQNHIVWQLRDGNNINFWMDKWTPSGSPLMTHLSPNIVSQIMAIPAPLGTDGDDTIGWKGTNTHHFTIQSTYDLQHGNGHHINGDWNKIWAWKGPHRIQTFMWIAAHARLLTNVRRSKWGVGVSPTCSICGNDDETMIHTLRDCIYATGIWLRLVSSNQITNFFSSFDCREWIFLNLNTKNFGNQQESWKSIFMVVCWHIWTWRNKAIFEEDFQRPNDPSQVILRMTKDIKHYKHTLMTGIRRQRETIYIGWKYPHGDWIKLNCDGAYKDSMNIAGCGGLFRDSDGRWLKGYTLRIGDCDALHAEMWGMYTGMKMARRQGYTHLIVESDSKLLIDMVTGRCKLNGNSPILVKRIQDLSNLQWHVIFQHTWREGNRCADWLASFSLNQSSYDVRILENPPRELQHLLFDDITGACMPRSVRVIL
ncbi:hypothetical protein TSUD_213680 [Trifolium subterraneum]|uniref:RNase H type-1 domain-containing protein n=1 Tax=Trifolium subterraneum TaxID=3900 RepID=A0A2Z6MVY2_TRISU|nr:hypothetical protein TSUD_213680 [Trifolium subterraneum]